MNTITSLTPQQLRKAAGLKEKIQSLEKELAQLLGSSAPAVVATAKPSAKPAKKKKGQMSAAGRAAIVAAQKARWAAKKAAVPAAKPVAVKAPAKKRKMSAATKAMLKAKMKAYWAAKKAKAKK